MKSTKKSLLMSTISLVLCFAMLLGTTWAWFTDEVTSGVNQIKAGNLDVELYAGDTKVTETTKLFTNIEKWEPGMIAYENFTVKNVGNLALKYQLALNIGDKNATTEGHSLDEVLKATIVPGGFSGDRAAAQVLTGYTDLKSFSVTGDGALEPGAEDDTFGVVIYWQPTDNDNLYNLKNGLKATPIEGKFNENELGIELGIKLTATQLPYEEDSFDKFYDKADNEVIATWSGESDEVTIPESGTVTMQVKEGNKVHAEATVEAGTQIKVEGQEETEFASLTADEKLKLTIEPDGTPNGITVQAGNSVTTYDVSLIKVVTTIEEGGGETKTTTEIVEADKPVLVSLDIGVVDLQAFYHHGTELTKVDSQDLVDTDKYYYNQANGTVYFKTMTFSPFASVYKFAGGLGTEEHPYLIATTNDFDGIHVSAKASTSNSLANVKFKLIADVDYTGKTFPSATKDRIVWDNVTFDGNNHKIIGANATPAGEDFPECLMGNKYTGTNEIKNLTIENSAFNGLFYAGYSNTNSECLKITDVTIRNCAAYDGAFVNWGGNTRVEIKNSKLENSSVMYRGWAGSVGGFIGNTQNALIENSAIISSTIESGSNSAVGGFICQGGANAVVTNCTVDADSVVRNTNAAQYAYAIAGSLSSASSSTGNTFLGRVECAGTNMVGIAGLDATSYTKASVCSVYNSAFTADQFTFSDNGTITYNGTGTYDKFVVEQRIWTSNCTSGEYTGVGGFQKDFDKHEFSTKDLTFTKLTKLQQYAPNATVAAMFKATTTDGSYVGEQYASNIATGGVIYIKDGVCTAKFLDEAGNGQFIGGTGKTDDKTNYTVTVLVKAMVGDTNVGSTSFTYVVPLATN